MSSGDTIGEHLSAALLGSRFAGGVSQDSRVRAVLSGEAAGHAFRAAELAYDLAWEQATTRAADIIASAKVKQKNPAMCRVGGGPGGAECTLEVGHIGPHSHPWTTWTW